jgi:LuxR family maltose regulon positive regulatory protein
VSCTGGQVHGSSKSGELLQTIRHALAARDFEQAARLVELAIPVMLKARQEVTLRAWLEALPDDVIRVRPVLEIGYVGVLINRTRRRLLLLLWPRRH